MTEALEYWHFVRPNGDMDTVELTETDAIRKWCRAEEGTYLALTDAESHLVMVDDLDAYQALR